MRGNKLNKRLSIALESVALGESVATEGFLDLLKKWFSNKEEKKTESEISVYKWVTDNTRNETLNPGFELVGSEIKIGLPTNLFLSKELPDTIDIVELAKLLAADMRKYDAGNVEGVSEFKKANDVKNALEDDLEDAYDDWEVFKKIVLSYKNKLPKSYKLKDAPQLASLESKREIVVSIASINDVNKLLKTAADIWMHQFRLGDSIGNDYGLDASDPPFRGFMDEITDDEEILNILTPFWHSEFEERYPNPVDEMVDRLEKIYGLLINLVRRSVK